MIEHVGFTGTQLGMQSLQLRALRVVLKELNGSFLHHGDCMGADAESHDMAVGLGYRICIHPPTSSLKRAFMRAGKVDVVYPEKDYLDRNKDIVNATGCLIAAPSTMIEKTRSGTWSTVRYARKLGKHVFLIFSNGSVSL